VPDEGPRQVPQKSIISSADISYAAQAFDTHLISASTKLGSFGIGGWFPPNLGIN
jgi:hypothetical protein